MDAGEQRPAGRRDLRVGEHFESGCDRERAARTYWVPIWALLFSMLGAFTHIFRMIFAVTEYAHQLTFNRIDAADSVLANDVIRNSCLLFVAVVVGIRLFIHFSDIVRLGDRIIRRLRSNP